MPKVNIILADDHPTNYEGMQKYLEDTGHYIVLGCAGDYASLEQLLEIHNPEIALVDIDMPPGGSKGEAILERLVQKFSTNVSFVVLTMYEKIPLAKRLKQKGLKGYLLKKQTYQEIEKRLNLLFTKRVHAFHPDIQEKIFNAEIVEPLNFSFSPREIGVIKLLCKGYGKEKRKKHIKKLGISEQTFYTHRTRIYKKAEVSNVKELIHMAYKMEIITNKEMLE